MTIRISFEVLELVEYLDGGLGSRSGTGRVLTSDESTINNMEVVPDSGGSLICK